jgi:hypothetical protein
MNVRTYPDQGRCTLPLANRATTFGLLVLLLFWCSPLAASDYSDTCNFNQELCGWVAESEPPAALKSSTESAPAEGPTKLEQYVGESMAKIRTTIAESVQLVRMLNEWYTSISFQSTTVIEIPPDPVIEITPSDRLVGSGPMVFTLAEPYLPYDLSVTDLSVTNLRLQSTFPLAVEPFCVRGRAAEPTVNGPVDCWLSEMIDLADRWTASDSPLHRYTDPTAIGRQLAAWAASGHRSIQQVTAALAARWPEPHLAPSRAGSALLTRAEADIAAQPVARVARTATNAH